MSFVKSKDDLLWDSKRTIPEHIMWNYKFPTKVSICISVFFCKNVLNLKIYDYHMKLFNKTNIVFSKYNMECNQLIFTDKPIDFDIPISTEALRQDEQIEDIRRKIHTIYDDQNDEKNLNKIKRVPIIYLETNDKLEFVGKTIPDRGWLPFVLMATDKLNNSDFSTILHELGHCAGLKHIIRDNKTNPKLENIMMTSEDGFDLKSPPTPFKREHISRQQADNFVKSYFSFINI